MNVLEGMTNMGETECFFVAKKPCWPMKGPPVALVFAQDTCFFCRQRAGSRLFIQSAFFPGSITAEGSCLTPAVHFGSGKRAV